MSEPLPSLDDLEVAGKRVMVRCDLNVPLKGGRITDDLRIRSAVPTLEALLQRDARIVVCSHLGRPKGKVVADLRLNTVAERLGEVLRQHVTAVTEVVGPQAERACRSEASVVVLE